MRPAIYDVRVDRLLVEMSLKKFMVASQSVALLAPVYSALVDLALYVMRNKFLLSRQSDLWCACETEVTNVAASALELLLRMPKLESRANGVECVICLCAASDSVAPCGHPVHASCFSAWQIQAKPLTFCVLGCRDSPSISF